MASIPDEMFQLNLDVVALIEAAEKPVLNDKSKRSFWYAVRNNNVDRLLKDAENKMGRRKHRITSGR